MDGPDGDFIAWDCVWRALVDGVPVHEPGAVTFDVDLGRSFAPDDDPEEIATFLRNAGFLHLRGWLDPADMATIADDIARAEPTYSKGDGRSWWATTNDGSDRAVRLQHFHQHSPTTLAILDGPEWDRLREVLGGGVDNLEHRAATPIASRRSSSRSASCAGSPTCPGTATARSGATPTAARARPSASR